MLIGRRLFQLLLVGTAVLSLLLGSSIIQSGVNASIIPANNPGVQQCGGGGCPTATETGIGCDPYSWYYYDSKYKVNIISVDPDKDNYRPGEVVEISGTVRLLRQDAYVNGCGEVGVVPATSVDPSGVTVQLSGPFGTGDPSGVSSDGAFTAEVHVPDTAESGSVTYTVTATYHSAGDEDTFSFDIEAFAPSLAVAMSDGDFAYPGGTCTVSGSGWRPNGQVTVNYGSLGVGSPVTADDSGSFTASPITVPPNTAEGSYPITGTEPSNLETGGVACVVKWHQLVIALNISPSPVQQGDTVAITGTVTDDEGKPVADAAVSFSVSGGKLPTPSSATTDASGQFTSGLTVGDSATADSYTITASAQKTNGYHSGSKDGSLQVKVRPPAPSLIGAVAGTAGAIIGTLVSIALAPWPNPSGGVDQDQQSRMLADMQQQNMQNMMFQQEVNRQSQRFTTLSNAQKAMHDAIMATLNNAKGESPSLFDRLVGYFFNTKGDSQVSKMLADMQQQNMQNMMFQQEVNRQSQRFTTLSNAQKAMHDAIMAMLNNAK